MRILSVDSKPFHHQSYLNAGPGGRQELARLRWYHARVDRLPEGCDALVCASDLQGRVTSMHHASIRGSEERLLGEAVAAELEALSDARSLPPLGKTAAILAGDLYSIPGAKKRGGYGPVDTVLRAFVDRTKWLIAVAGNHDDISNLPAGVEMLDGDTVEAGGMRISGVSRVCGNPAKPGKRDEDEQRTLIDIALEDKPEVLVLHEGPEHGEGFPGSAWIREKLLRAKVGLTIFGHTAWAVPFTELAPGVGALNVHERVVVLRA